MGVPMKNLDDLLDKIPNIIKEEFVTGLSIVIIEDGKIYASNGYGLADKRKHEPATSKTLFQISSLSKALTAWGVLHVCEKKNIDIDSPIENYVKRWKFPSSKYSTHGVTVRSILHHMAGLSVMSYYGTRKNTPDIIDSLNGQYDKRYKLEVFVEPGENLCYSGGGFTLLQLFIEEVTGQSFESYMKDNVIHPLGMYNTFYNFEDVKDLGYLAKPYSPFGKRLPYYNFTEKAAAELYTSSYDLGLFMMAYMEKNEVLSENYKAILSSRFDRRVRCGCGNYVFNSHGEKIILQRGQNRGWFSSMDIMPNKKSGIAILTNSYNGQNAILSILSKWYHIQLNNQDTIASTFLLKRHGRLKISFFDALIQMKLYKYRVEVMNLSGGKLNGNT